MPNTTSAKKALRQSVQRQQQNLKRKAAIKSVVKRYKKLVESGNTKKAEAFLPEVYKTLDKLAKVYYLNKNKARRLKSQLASKLAERKTK